MWGIGTQGALGQNDTVQRSSPVQVPGNSWIEVSLGLYNSLARKSDGTLWGWGRNTAGELGLNDIVNRSSPVQIPGTQWVEISGKTALVNHVLGRKSDGTLWTWGIGTCGVLGISNTTSRSSPVQIPGTQWVEVATGERASLARKSDGTLWAWGASYITGQNDSVNRSSPIQIPGTQWFDISGGSARGFPVAAARKTV
jgi:alpha-tubulin suppressor-like RCC1 family protein